MKVYDRTPVEKVLERIGDADAILMSKILLTRSIFESCKNLKFAGVLATGYNVVDVDAAKDNGVVVTNIPPYGTAAVAQMTFALLLEACNHVWSHSEAVHKGDWTKNPD